MANPPTTLDAPVRIRCDAELSIGAAAQAEGADGKKALPTFTMTGYTGAAVNVGYYRFPMAFDLASMRIRGTIPILVEHAASWTRSTSSQVFGHTSSVENDGKRLKANGVVSGIGPDVDHLLAIHRNGFPLQASVGLEGGKIEFVEAGDTVAVNGRTLKGPILVARNTRLREISVLPMGADADTETRIAARAARESDMADENDTAGGATVAAGAEPTNPQPKAQAPHPKPGAVVDEIRAQAAAEHERITAVTRIAAGNGEICAKAIKEGWDANRTELEILRASRSTGVGAPNVIVRDTSCDANAIAAGICFQLNLPQKVITRDFKGVRFDEKTLEAGKRFRGIGLKELCRITAQMEGKSVPMVWGDGEDTIRASFTTAALPSILENVLNKTLLAAYEASENVAPRLCAIGSTNDFKQTSKVRLLGTGGWEQVAPDGELKAGKLGEQKFTNVLDTYGQLIMLDRPMIINDDVGALASLATQMGIAGAQTIDHRFFTVLLANANNFFHANNSNYQTGAGTAFGVVALASARSAFRKIKVGPGSAAKDKRSVNIAPRKLLVPVELETDAAILMTSAQVLIDGNSSAKTVAADNPMRNAFELVTAPQLSDTDYTGNSALAYYLFANPALVPAFEILFLNGKQTPTIERVDPGPGYLGMGFRGWIDFGIAQQDPRGALKVKGEA